MKLLIMQFSPLLCYQPPFSPNIFLNTMFSKSLSLYSSLNQRGHAVLSNASEAILILGYIV